MCVFTRQGRVFMNPAANRSLPASLWISGSHVSVPRTPRWPSGPGAPSLIHPTGFQLLNRNDFCASGLVSLKRPP